MTGMTKTNEEATYLTGIRLWNRWTEMWNGKPELALELAAPRFVLHLVKPSPTDEALVVDPPSVERWVRAHLAKYTRLVFDTSCGPFVDVRAGVVAAPWWADAVIDGAAKQVCGMDTLAFRDGKVTEYWTLAMPTADVGRWATQIL
jgi:hypothetical protein